MKKIVCITFMLAAMGGSALAQQEGQKAEEPKLAEKKIELKKEIYTYQSMGRRDPFLSIITATKLQQEKEMKKGAAPLEAFDVMQMTVVAIVEDKASSEFYALLKMPDGKHFTVKKDSVIGLHGGRVKQISLDKVVVTEKVRNYKGELVSQDTELKLRKGEEE